MVVAQKEAVNLPLILAFALTALAYAAVGFGGGSTYNALLVLAGVDYRVLPTIALSCNIIVVTGGCWQFWRAGHLKADLLLPFCIVSVPMAWFGGSLPVSETLFIGLLGLSLLLAGLQLLIKSPLFESPAKLPPRRRVWLVGAPAGAALGMLAGIVGIGGGIFLAPLLHILGWGSPAVIAGTASVFIFINSVAGLSGQLWKLGDLGQLSVVAPYAWLFLAVLVGGQIGSRIGANKLPGQWIRRLTSLLVLYVALRLLLRWYTTVFSA